MKRVFVLHAILVFALLGFSAPAPAAEDNSEVAQTYFEAFVLCNTGMKAVEAGQRENAISNLKSAQAIIQEIQRNQPDWQPALVAHRLKRIENVLKSLGAK